MKYIVLAVTFVVLAAFWLSAQTKPPLTCSEIVGDLYIQNSQLQRQVADATQRAALAEQELSKLKEAK